MSPAEREHLWANEHLTAFSSGLMRDADVERFERHLAGCEECRQALDALVAPEASRGRHLPDALIARWPKTRASLAGLQRELVRRHLADCDECQAILKYMGHVPELEHVAGLEPSAAVLDMLYAVRAASETPVKSRKLVEPPRQRWSLREFLFGGAVGGLVTAAAAFAIMSSLALHPAPGPGPVNPAAPGLRLELGSGTAASTLGSIESGALVRGAAGDTTVALAAGQTSVRLALTPEPDLAPETQVALELQDSTGAMLMRTSMPYSYLLDSDRGLAIASEGALPATDLTLLMTWTDAAGTRHAVHYFVHLRR